MLDHGTALAAVAVIGVAGVVARALAARLPIPLPIVLLAVGSGTPPTSLGPGAGCATGICSSSPTRPRGFPARSVVG